MFTEAIHPKSSLILDILPQKPPFRYIEAIHELDEAGILGSYTFKEDEWFYQGHFPGRPVTPGVIQIEAMAQTSVVAYGLFLTMLEQERDPSINPSDFLTVFTDCEVEFMKEVKPGTQVFVRGKKLFWRRRKLRCEAELYLPDGSLAACGKLSGMGVQK